MIAELAWPFVVLVGLGVVAKLTFALLAKLEVMAAWVKRVEQIEAKARSADDVAHDANVLSGQNSSHLAKLSARMDALEAPRAVAQAVRR